MNIIMINYKVNTHVRTCATITETGVFTIEYTGLRLKNAYGRIYTTKGFLRLKAGLEIPSFIVKRCHYGHKSHRKIHSGT